MEKILKTFILAGCTIAFGACSNDDEPAQINPDSPTKAEGAFVLNQGTYGQQIEGSLTLIDYNKGDAYQNLFLNANGRSIGATPQGAVVYGSKIYLGIYESNTIEVIDRTDYKSVKQISLAKSQGQSPRSLVAQGGKVYISMFNGYVCRLDTATLEIDKTVEVGPNPEIMAILGNYLYVPNSDGLNWQTGYGTTASKIDLRSFTVAKTFTVGLNPAQFVSNGSELFLLCKGNYGDVPSTVYRVDSSDKSEKFAEATLMGIRGDNLYCINAPWDATDFDYAVYNTKSGRRSDMIADDGVESPAGLGIDPVNGNIVITSNSIVNGWASYTTDGYAKVYDASGAFMHRYATGVGPCVVFFNYK